MDPIASQSSRYSFKGATPARHPADSKYIRCSSVRPVNLPCLQMPCLGRPVHPLARSRVLMPAAATEGSCSNAMQKALLEELMAATGTWTSLALQDGANGRGMFASGCETGPAPPPPDSTAQGTTVYISVPSEYALSSVEGACQEAALQPLLQDLLAGSFPWEIRLGGILAVARSPAVQHKEGSTLEFWQRYLAEIVPSEYTSALFFSPEELAALQDPDMEQTGRAWQAKVEAAYESCFAGNDCPITLAELCWGVGTAQSRAFSVSKGASGQDDAVVVPFLDMLNHRPHSVCYHTFSEARGRYELRALGVGIPCGEEATISYGATGNDRLVRQYGFLVPANPFDRLPLPEAEAIGIGRLDRHKVVVAMGMDQDYGPRSPEMEALHSAACRAAEELAGRHVVAEEEPWRFLWGEDEKRRTDGVAATLLEKVCHAGGATPSSPGDEAASITGLLQWVDRQLQGLLTSPEEDGALLLAGCGSPRMELAVRHRLERKLCLLSALRTLQILQAAWQAACPMPSSP
mmetsp:Transcript_2073/g.6158  ORF Transcript_2073/g.6158 Transcript_2073/m.6158 type:complete len:520 (-) Transcript_2073:385-1944(-)|eukprot:CAMPEP_0117660106 /NCGR_PEP_ID=MMETSP0804-20121206/6789_1 /TAXON_ID=1074897 /ORGANISM="Tetraselmis astigmatica, Strain CCMP880" /LENGTH=519 /DNA_ID=CAMNT_0005466809 /DNA_START=287 /DNA_END=1846 /DNA_ORIENTATION=+